MRGKCTACVSCGNVRWPRRHEPCSWGTRRRRSSSSPRRCSPRLLPPPPHAGRPHLLGGPGWRPTHRVAAAAVCGAGATARELLHTLRLPGGSGGVGAEAVGRTPSHFEAVRAGGRRGSCGGRGPWPWLRGSATRSARRGAGLAADGKRGQADKRRATGVVLPPGGNARDLLGD
jgi:hypothetical protein